MRVHSIQGGTEGMTLLQSIHSARALRRLVVVIACGSLLLASAAPALAADIQQGDTVVIGPDQVVNDDVYAFGSNVQILGTVNGDVFAAGNSVTVAGRVAGSVFAAGNTVAITGEVRNGVHAAGNTVGISGPVAEDATLASGTLTVAPGARIGRDLLMATGTANLGAPIGRNVEAAAGDLNLAAPVGGNVRAQVTTLRLSEGARVDGSLTYTSDRDASIAPGATAAAGVQHLLPQARSQLTPPVGSSAWAVVDWVKGLVGLGVIGLLLTLLLPRFSTGTIEVARTAFWSSLGVGFALFVGVPIIAVLAFIVGIIIGGWMLGFALLAIYAMACAVGYTFAAIFTGNLVVQALRQPPQHLAWNLLEGLALLGLIGLVPIVGGVVLFLACVFGLGAFAMSIILTYRRSQPAVVVTPAVTAVKPQLAAA
jgi:cytoskeletal protein CcmA (bactofilin family)